MFSERRRGAVAPLVAAALGALSASAEGKVFLTLDEALRSAFPGCEATSETIYLSKEQQTRAAGFAKGDVPSALVIRHRKACKAGAKDADAAELAYTDTHRVRTKPETLFVVVDGKGVVRRIEVLSFDEPPEYRAKPEWYAQFGTSALTDNLELRGRIRPILGASLTARATTAAVRRILAIDQVLREDAKK